MPVDITFMDIDDGDAAPRAPSSRGASPYYVLASGASPLNTPPRRADAGALPWVRTQHLVLLQARARACVRGAAVTPPSRTRPRARARARAELQPGQ